MLYCVVWNKLTNVSEVLTASIIRAMKKNEARREFIQGSSKCEADM
jgi:hypothetical protein